MQAISNSLNKFLHFASLVDCVNPLKCCNTYSKSLAAEIYPRNFEWNFYFYYFLDFDFRHVDGLDVPRAKSHNFLVRKNERDMNGGGYAVG